MVHLPPASGNQYGRILMWGFGVSGQSGRIGTQAYLWDCTPVTSGTQFIDHSLNHTTSPDSQFFVEDRNLFCGGHTTDKNGDAFEAGGENPLLGGGFGTNCSYIFSHTALSWTALPDMASVRWYPTVTQLEDSSVMAFAGSINNNGAHADQPEKYSWSSSTWSTYQSWRDANQTLPMDSDDYPLTFTYYNNSTQPRVFWAGRRRISGGANGLISHYLNLNGGAPQWNPVGGVVAEGSGAVMWINGTSPMKRGWIIKVGGVGTFHPATETNKYEYFDTDAYTEYFDLDQDFGSSTTGWSFNIPQLNYARVECNLTFTPDGRIVVIGGCNRDHGYVDNHGSEANMVRQTEVLDPESTASLCTLWAPLPANAEQRWYHSSVVLHPDGSFLSGGGNRGIYSVEQNGRIFYPPYYNNTRPQIANEPSVIHWGSTFTVTSTDAANIAKVTLIRLPAVTHGFDQSGRFIRCDFTRNGNTLTATAPANGGVAPEGYYMLFLVKNDTNKTPSHARYVRITS